MHSKDWLLERNFRRTKITTVTLIWCLKYVKYFILTFSINESFFLDNEFWNLHTMILFFFFSWWMCWWGCWKSNKLSRIQMRLFPSVSHIDNHPFHDWWKSLSDYQKNYFNAYIWLNHSWWCKHNQS